MTTPARVPVLAVINERPSQHDGQVHTEPLVNKHLPNTTNRRENSSQDENHVQNFHQPHSRKKKMKLNTTRVSFDTTAHNDNELSTVEEVLIETRKKEIVDNGNTHNKYDTRIDRTL